jgi:hypothetical protein
LLVVVVVVVVVYVQEADKLPDVVTPGTDQTGDGALNVPVQTMCPSSDWESPSG